MKSARLWGEGENQGRLAVWVTLGALALVYFPLFIGRSLLSRDVGAWTAPARWLVREAFARGVLPHWCAWEGLGFPVAADPLFATFYPVNVLTLPLPLAWGTSVYLFAHLVWGALGVFALSRAIKLSAWAASVGALAWCLSGLIGSEWDGGVRLLPAAWFAWSALACRAVFTHSRTPRDSARAGLALALTGAMMALTGEVFVTLMGALFALTVGLFHARDLGLDRTAWRTATVTLVAAGALALLLSAPSWLPAVSLVTTTARATASTVGPRVEWVLHPLRIVDFALPHGIVDAQLAGLPAVVARFGTTPLYLSAYMGVTVLALASLAFSRSDRRWRPFALMALVATALALGNATPFYTVFVAVVRPFSRMSSPEKFLLVTQSSVALLAAIGTDRLLTKGSWRTLFLFAIGVVLACVSVAALTHGALTATLTRGGLGALARLTVLVALVGMLRHKATALRFAIFCLVLADLGPLSHFRQQWERGENQSAPVGLARYARSVNRTSRGASPPRMWRSPSVEFVTVPGVSPSITAQRRALLRPKFNLDTGVTVLPAYEAATSPEVDRLSRAGRVDPLRLLSVDLALTPSRHPPGLTFVREPAPGVRLFTVDDPLPRAFVAYSATSDPPERLSHLITDDVLHGRVVALAEHNQGIVASHTPTARSECTITRWAPGDVALGCTVRDRGVAVLVEQWAPGWVATVDGVSAPVVRVNRVALGVAVQPRGARRQVIHLRYVTPSMSAALTLGALGVFIVLGLALGLRGGSERHTDKN